MTQLTLKEQAMTPQDVPGRLTAIDDLFPWLLAVEPLLREPRTRNAPAARDEDATDEALPEAA